MQKTLNDFNIQIEIDGWIGITDNGNRYDVYVKSCLVDRENKKLIITGHNGIWVVNPNQIDFTH